MDLFVSDPVIVEDDKGTKKAVFEILLSEPASSALTVDYTTKDGSATAGKDYIATSGSVKFAVGQQVAHVSVEVKGDKIAEANEFFDLVVTPRKDATIGTDGLVGTATILDDDTSKLPEISVSNGFVGESSNYDVIFTVTLSKAATDAVTVQYQALPNGSAIDSDMYAFSSYYNSGTVTFKAGETTAYILISTRYDYSDERDESFTLQLYNTSENAVLAGGTNVLRATGVIEDNDGEGSDAELFLSDPVLVEGNKGSQIAIFEILLSEPASKSFKVDYTTKDGSAVAGEDYVATSGTIKFEAGQQVAYVSVDVKNDQTSEATEFFDLVVTPSKTVSLGTAGLVGTATIQDNDSGRKGPVISVSDGVAVEGNQMIFTVSLSKPATDAVTVEYKALSSGSADDNDLSYSFASGYNAGTVTFNAGETTAYIKVSTRYDYLDERDESFTLQLYNASEGVGLAGGVSTLRATGVILDDDGVGTNTMLVGSPDPIFEGAERSQLVAIDVHLSQPLANAQTFSVSATGLGAKLGKDFKLETKSITFEPGETDAVVWVKTFRDKAVEANETFTLDFTTKGTSYVNGTIPSITVTIVDGPGYIPDPTKKADKIIGSNQSETLRGLAGNDTISGSGGDDTIKGDNGNDLLEGDSGDDMIFGGKGADKGNGGIGADYIDGGTGNDILTGGAHPDDFAFDIARGGKDKITDFAGNDTLIFYRRGQEMTKEKAQAFVNEYATETKNGVLFDFGKGNTLLIEDADDSADLVGAISFSYDL
nr:Calx-beta domain-containing protein [Donghicola mangrovi]